MKLKIRTEKIIDLQEWDRLVKKTYGRPYSFQQQDGCKPRGTERIYVSTSEVDDSDMPDAVTEKVNGPERGVRFSKWLERDPKQPLSSGEKEQWQIDMWWERNFYPYVEAVANDLCRRGLLDPGEYLIEIDW